MDRPKLPLWGGLLVAALSFWSGLWLAPDRPMDELERLDLAITERRTELRTIDGQTSEAKAALRLVTTELGEVKSELTSTSSNLLDRLQSDMKIAGLSEQDVCEDYSLTYCASEQQNFCEEYAMEYCESKDEASYEDEAPCSGRGCP